MNIILNKSITFYAVMFCTLLFGQNSITKTARVKGECGMCKERIENTSLKHGATSANWNSNSQILTITFQESKTTLDKILREVANVGHDNEAYDAPNDVYDKLPGCCLYTRKPSFLNSENLSSTLKTSEYFVKGNCGSCKKRIENAALEAGAKTANWDANTQKVKLEFSIEETSVDKILKKISDVGHDNEMFNTTESVFKKLPKCCIYDRNLPFGEKNPLVHLEENENLSNNTQHKTNSDNIVGENSIDHVEIFSSKQATSISKKEAGLTFNISQKELLKAACCNLSESFETNATVDVSFNNAVTGTKQLKMLGLDQKYTSLTKELLPEIRGLASAYGLNFIPGRWIEGIQLTKGGSTVINGYESITGQINTELLKHSKTPETAINLFADTNTRTEVNITNTSSINDHWSQSILLHGNATITKLDHNDDGFLDQPIGNQINATYLLNYNGFDHSGFATHFGINFLQDVRRAGQMDYDWKKPQISQNKYGVEIDITRFQVWNKTGYIFKDKPYQSFGWMNQFTYHQQDSFFGLRDYFGTQNTFYSNLIFESIFGNTNHKYKTGASFMYDKYNETYLTNPFKRTETVPGLFFEYTLTGLNYTLVAGARTDFHNIAGTQFTPRLNFKYDVFPNTIVRVSAGKGFRTANIFAESQSFFASNRTLEIQSKSGNINDLKPEIAWNYGLSLQQEFKFLGRKSTFLIDYFRTDFQQQVVLDLDQSAQKIVYYNLNGKSFANSLQTQWDLSILRNLDLRLAYKYYDVKVDYNGILREAPFMAKHRGFVNISYATNKNSIGGFWSFDTTLNMVGKQRLPIMVNNPVLFTLPQYSQPFSTLSAQVSRSFNDKFRIYVGGENLTSYQQENPIIDSKNPFSNYFDGGMIYAPIMPVHLYLGIDIKF